MAYPASIPKSSVGNHFNLLVFQTMIFMVIIYLYNLVTKYLGVVQPRGEQPRPLTPLPMPKMCIFVQK